MESRRLRVRLLVGGEMGEGETGVAEDVVVGEVEGGRGERGSLGEP